MQTNFRARQVPIPPMGMSGIKGMMTGVSFDITSLLDFRPPKYICPACRGLFRMLTPEKRVDRRSPFLYGCPVCSVRYCHESGEDWAGPDRSVFEEFRLDGRVLDHGDLLAHATGLAEVVRDSRRRSWPTTRTFFEVISRARYFVHFSTWGISHVMIGALKMASMRVPVYGFASNVENHARVELTEYPDEAPKLTASVIPSDQGIYDAPHQKLLLIDGLVAFKGSTNLTNAGPRKADRGLDITEIVTDFQQVTDLNNKYFAPVWRRINSPEDRYTFISPF